MACLTQTLSFFSKGSIGMSLTVTKESLTLCRRDMTGLSWIFAFLGYKNAIVAATTSGCGCNPGFFDTIERYHSCIGMSLADEFLMLSIKLRRLKPSRALSPTSSVPSCGARLSHPQRQALPFFYSFFHCTIVSVIVCFCHCMTLETW